MDSEEIIINYEGFTERKIKLIKETIVLLQHVIFDIPDIDPTKNINVKIDGAMVGKPEYIYYTSPCKNGIHAQVLTKNSGQTLFGIYMYEKDGKKECIAYHSGISLPYDGVDDII
jgi:hypothetical protein